MTQAQSNEMRWVCGETREGERAPGMHGAPGTVQRDEVGVWGDWCKGSAYEEGW